MCVLYVFPPLQQDYRKIDVISKAEFDSQRDVEGDSDLVFGPLDQEDAPPAPAITTTTVSSKPETQAPQQRLPEREAAAGHRGRGHEMPSRGRGSVSPHSRQRRRKDKRARFYPVLNKQHNSPSDVSTRMYCVCVGRPSFGVPLCVLCGLQLPAKQKTKYSSNPPVEGHVGWVMSSQDTLSASSSSSRQATAGAASR